MLNTLGGNICLFTYIQKVIACIYSSSSDQISAQGVKKMKIAEALAFCGDRGAYFLSQLDLDDKIKDAFITVLECCSSLINKVMTKPVCMCKFCVDVCPCREYAPSLPSRYTRIWTNCRKGSWWS